MKLVRASQTGATLLEVIVAVAMIVLVLVPLFKSISIKMKAVTLLQNKIAQVNLSDALMEFIATKKWDQNTVDSATFLPLASCTPVAQLGPDTGETTSASFDDIDDFKTTTPEIISGYKREVIVEYVNIVNNQPTTVAVVPTAAKRVTINIWPVDKPDQKLSNVRVFFDGIAY